MNNKAKTDFNKRVYRAYENLGFNPKIPGSNRRKYVRSILNEMYETGWYTQLANAMKALPHNSKAPSYTDEEMAESLMSDKVRPEVRIIPKKISGDVITEYLLIKNGHQYLVTVH